MVIRRLCALALCVATTVLAGSPAASSQSPPPVRVDSGIQYANPKGQPQLLDAYVPAGHGPFPTVILVHGGGWEYGDRSNMADIAKYLAVHGFVAFTIDYRLANPKRVYNPYPAAVEDVQTAIRWVRQHAADYGADPARLGLLGSSAGAHLVSLVGMMGKGPLDGGTRVRAVVSWSGPQDMVELYRDGPLRAKTSVEAFTNCHGGLPACEPILKEMSPITYVDHSDPPLFFANGTSELVPEPQALEMDRALAEAGVQHLFVEVPGSLHAQHYSDQTAPSLPAGQTVLQGSLAWLQRWLAEGPPPSSRPSPSTGGSEVPVAKGSGTLTLLVLVVAGVAVALFALFTISRTLRRRALRARRVREWKDGQRRRRSSTGSGSGGRSPQGSSRSTPGSPRE